MLIYNVKSTCTSDIKCFKTVNEVVYLFIKQVGLQQLSVFTIVVATWIRLSVSNGDPRISVTKLV